MRQALPRPPRLEAANVAAFRFRRLDGRYLVTDELGRCRFLTPQAFRRLVAGAPPAGLARRRLRLERLASSWRRRQRLPWSGPGRHVVIVADGAARMTIETARSVVDTILESPNPELAVELRGAALKASRPVVSFLTAYARRKSRLADKRLRLFLDAPPGSAGGAAAPAVTRRALSRARETVERCFRRGSAGIRLKPLDPPGRARPSRRRIGYTPQEFLRFYAEALGRVLELNERRRFYEETARGFLAKILLGRAPERCGLNSPCGAATARLAYDCDGGVYPCEEGLRLGRAGDETFRLARAGGGAYESAVGHAAVRAMAVASCLDNQPCCSQCAYQPYCGVCPIQCYAEQGDIMGRMPTNSRCLINQGILDLLMRKLRERASRRILRSWLS